MMIMEKECIWEGESGELWKRGWNEVLKWGEEEDDGGVMEWLDWEREMVVNKGRWKYEMEEEERVWIVGVKFIEYEDL